MGTESKPLDFGELKRVVAGRATAIRCRTILQPAAGPGTKVFPPTYAGGVYATEQRRIPVPEKPGQTRVVECVLLDSVQSQANRIEDALQQAIDHGPLKMPLIVVNFGDATADVQRVTSLQAPHRAADAILRDSILTRQRTKDSEGNEVERDSPFRNSMMGTAIINSSLGNATGLFQYCPHALFLGIWDSTGPKGGQGAKFARALVSEIVGIDIQPGARSRSRIDPLQIAKQAGPLFRRPDGGWTLDATQGIQEKDKNGEPTGRVLLYKKVQKRDVYFDPVKQAGEVPDAGKPSAANHGNVTPDIKDENGIELIGGVTMSLAEHTAVLSLPQLRRLRFPIDKMPEKVTQTEVDNAARTVLAALALVGLTLSLEKGCDLRSRCLLFPEGLLSFELLETPGKPTPIALDSTQAIVIYNEAVEAARKVGLPWDVTPITLTPSPELIALVKKSQELAAAGEGE